ncbi:MAG: DUF2080 family transposase-associated protein [Candidatus Hodarchaeales archaeon]
MLGIDPDFQDQGVGTALASKVFAYFSQKGIRSIRTICAWDWGDLVEFFSSVGFTMSDYLTLELNIIHQSKFEVYGEEMLEKKVKKSGNSGRVYLPPSWIGTRVKIIRMDKISPKD